MSTIHRYLQREWRAVGGLSRPSKMPGFAWGIPARRCITGSKLVKIEGTVCSKCYALKGRYVFPGVQHALERRLRAYNRDPERWVRNMTHLIRFIGGEQYFRWFDSGDLQSVEMLHSICSVSYNCTPIKFWLSTREHGIVKDYMSEFNWIPDNLNIRLAVHKIDSDSLPAPSGDCYGITACRVLTHKMMATRKHGFNCPAQHQGNSCGSCRRCWDQDVPLVNYPLH